jgi:hypothetical protein
MNSQFNINQELSLMIPRVFPQWIDEGKIIEIFHRQEIGKVYKVNIIRKPDEEGRNYPIYQAFIYFHLWYDNEIAYNFQQRIYYGKKQARVVYDDPWYWVVFENKKHHLTKNDIRLMRMGQQIYTNEQSIKEQTNNFRHLQKFCMMRSIELSPIFDCLKKEETHVMQPTDVMQPTCDACVGGEAYDDTFTIV